MRKTYSMRSSKPSPVATPIPKPQTPEPAPTPKPATEWESKGWKVKGR